MGSIYCIEGVWGYEGSVEPMLEMLRKLGQWDYRRRDCATAAELKYYLDNEWEPHGSRRQRPKYSVLYLATHGSPGSITLSGDEYFGLDTLGEWLEGRCQNCLVHFGGCEILGGKDVNATDQRIKTFLRKTEARGISGYGKPVGWTDVRGPAAVALELMLFSTISTEQINLADGRSFRKLTKPVNELKKKFEKCEFNLHPLKDLDTCR